MGLKGLVAGRSAAVIGLVVLALVTGSPSPALAQQKQIVAPDALDRSIDDVLQQREFSWRMPREMPVEDPAEPKGPVASVVAWIFDKLAEGIKTVSDWIDQFIDWLLALLPTGVIGVRAAAGSENAAGIFFPTWFASGCATVVGITVAMLLSRLPSRLM